jgi:hypothetical protein
LHHLPAAHLSGLVHLHMRDDEVIDGQALHLGVRLAAVGVVAY